MRRILISLALALNVAAIGCSSSGGPAPETSETAKTADAITIYESSNRRLVGSFSMDGNSIEFEIERRAEGHVANFLRTDGSLLLRTELAAGRESVELPGGLRFEGDAGSLFGSSQPRWEAITITGDVTTASGLAADGNFALIGKLPAALAEHPEVDLSILPVIDFHAPEGATEAATPFPSLQPQSHDPAGCAGCHTGCAVGVVVCVGLTWGIFAWLCAAPGIACHVSCATSVCR